MRSREELEREILAFKNIHRLSGSTDALKWVDMLTKELEAMDKVVVEKNTNHTNGITIANSKEMNIVYKRGKNIQVNRENEGLAEVLNRCRKTAVKGFTVAERNNNMLGQYIEKHQDALEKQLKLFNETSIPENCEIYIKQLKEALSRMDALHNEIKNELINNKDNLTNFTIVVYGKTMTGKSTLMETLLKGNGQSIGKGLQRTTLDVRSYRWNNLQIYDTPGIAASASGGREDERKAYEVAKEADMIVFLLGDDNISDEEAKAFAKLKKMGKPILVVLNAKYDLTNKRSAKLMLKKLNTVMSKERIKVVEDDFVEHVKNQSISWKGIKFVGVHLQAAYLAQKGQSPIEGLSAKELFNISNFKDIENAVIAEITNKGVFYQYKVFVDIAYKQTEEIFNTISKELDILNGMVASFTNNKQKLASIKKQFNTYGLREVDNFIRKIKRELESQVDDFADYYYDMESAGDEWKDVIEKLGIEARARDLFKLLGDECSDKIEEFQKNFVEEINLQIKTKGIGEGIGGYDITDYKFNFTLAVDIGGALLAGASYLGLIGLGLGPIGWGVAGLTLLIGWLFDDKDEKIREAKRKMRNSLRESIEKIECKLKEKLPESFKNTFIEGYIDKVEMQFNYMAALVNVFNGFENNLSTSLSIQLNEMNIQLLKAACENMGMSNLIKNVVRIERITGQRFTIEIKGVVDIPDKYLGRLEELLQEEVVLTKENKTLAV